MNTRLVLVLLAALPAIASACGHQRWAVKTGADRDASKINLNETVPAEVEDLISIKAPAQLLHQDRIMPVEMSVYYVKARLIAFKLDKDGDYHLVLAGRRGRTMIAEIPSPRCVELGSPFLAGIKKARQQFNSHYVIRKHFRHIDRPVTVTGVGFFNFHRDQMGAAPNAIELHPVLDIQFGS